MALYPKLRRVVKRNAEAVHELRLRNGGFALVSDNCWGIDLYRLSGRQYNTPFIGLFLYPSCYLQLLQGLDAYLAGSLQFVSQSRYHQAPAGYPVGLLGGDVEIHFLHYSSPAEALAKWSRRAVRLRQSLDDGATLLVKMDDRDGASADQLRRFHAFTGCCHRISFGSVPIHGCANHLHVRDLIEWPSGQVADGYSLYAKRYRYFDLVEWIRSGRVVKTGWSTALSWLS